MNNFFLFLQALCWPNGSKVISSWFSGPEKNTVFGLYGTSAFAGGIFGTVLSVSIYILRTCMSSKTSRGSVICAQRKLE